MLLTGTGVTNQAAIHAGGLNAEEAKRHFAAAAASAEDGVASPAAEALRWCEMEVSGAWFCCFRSTVLAGAQGCVSHRLLYMWLFSPGEGWMIAQGVHKSFGVNLFGYAVYFRVVGILHYFECFGLIFPRAKLLGIT